MEEGPRGDRLLILGIIFVIIAGVVVVGAGLLDNLPLAMAGLASMLLMLLVLAGVLAWVSPPARRPFIVVMAVIASTLLGLISHWWGPNWLTSLIVAAVFVEAAYLAFGARLQKALVGLQSR